MCRTFTLCVINELLNYNCYCIPSCRDHCISTDTIFKSIKLLKSGKNDGFDGLTSDYLLKGSPLLFDYLSLLFTCMLSHSLAHDNFLYPL